jgi:hypothetical protein
MKAAGIWHELFALRGCNFTRFLKPGKRWLKLLYLGFAVNTRRE